MDANELLRMLVIDYELYVKGVLDQIKAFTVGVGFQCFQETY